MSTTRVAACHILAMAHLAFRYGQIRPTDNQSQLFDAVKRSIDLRKLASSTNSENAGTLRSSSSAVHPARGPFSHSGIGELKPTLRRPMRIVSGIRPSIARRAIILLNPSDDL